VSLYLDGKSIQMLINAKVHSQNVRNVAAALSNFEENRSVRKGNIERMRTTREGR
jgi:hypothetical protein